MSGSRTEAQQALERHLATTDWAAFSPSKRLILEAFLRLATTQGFNSVSMRMIARAVNIKAPSIYAHFPEGRDEIVAESLRYHFYRFGLALLDAVNGITNAGDYWNAMVRLHFTRQVRLPESNLWDLLVATDRTVRVLPPGLSEQVEHWVGLYEAMYLTTAAEMGYKDADEQVRMVMTFLEGATRWYTGPTSEADLDEAVERAISLTCVILSLHSPARV